MWANMLQSHQACHIRYTTQEQSAHMRDALDKLRWEEASVICNATSFSDHEVCPCSCLGRSLWTETERSAGAWRFGERHCSVLMP